MCDGADYTHKSTLRKYPVEKKSARGVKKKVEICDKFTTVKGTLKCKMNTEDAVGIYSDTD